MSDDTKVTEGDAIAELARRGESPETLGLVGDLMARNARDREFTFQVLYESEKALREEAERDLWEAQKQLARARRRCRWLFGEIDLEPHEIELP